MSQQNIIRIVLAVWACIQSNLNSAFGDTTVIAIPRQKTEIFDSKNDDLVISTRPVDETLRPLCRPPQGFIPVRTPQDLQNIRNNLTGNYFLCNDLDMTNFVFTPIGIASWQTPNPFRGTLEGNSKRIYNLNLGSPSAQNVGIFAGFEGRVQNLVLENVRSRGGAMVGTLAGHMYWNSVVENVQLRNINVVQAENPNVSNPWNAGGLAGACSGRISNIVAEVHVQGTFQVGGLCGYSVSTFNNPRVSGEVIGHSYVGGLAGDAAGGIYGARISVNVQGGNTVGGILGNAQPASISNSISTGNVEATGLSVGGMVGALVSFGGSSISDSYATGDVTSTAGAPIPDLHSFPGVGGLVGTVSFSTDPQWINMNPRVNATYSIGRVSGPANLTGGLIGVIGDGQVSSDILSSYYSRNYWDTETSGMNTSAAGYGLTTSEFTNGEPLDGLWPGFWIYNTGAYPTLAN